jgi:hypothetical protein
MLKYNGNLPNSDNTAMLVVLLCTPRMNLQNFKCIFSHNDPEKILSKDDSFRYGNENIECVSNCKYLGIWFSSSGSYSYAQNELYKKSLKAFLKLRKDLLSLNGLNMPQISLPYNKIGAIVWSNTCMLVLIFRLSDNRSFLNFKNAFRDFLYNSF